MKPCDKCKCETAVRTLSPFTEGESLCDACYNSIIFSKAARLEKTDREAAKKLRLMAFPEVVITKGRE